MKKSLFLLFTLGSLTSLSQAANLYYAGADGGWWEEAGNWRVDSPSGSTSPSKPATNDTMYIGSFDNSFNVNIGNNQGSNLFYNMNVHIAKGSTLTVQKSDAKFWGSTFTIGSANGLIFQENVWGDQIGGGRNPITFNLGNECSVAFQKNFNAASSAYFNFNGTLSIEMGGDYSIERRALMTFNTVVGDFDFSKFNVDFTAEGVTTVYDQDATLTASADDLGKYKLVYDADGKTLYVEYVTGAVPEPAIASLDLLDLGALMLRRRRY